MNLLIFGPPGAGKGTQAALISKRYKLTHLSSGDILRAELKTGELGAKIKTYQDAGKLVPDALIITIMEKAIIKNIKKGGVIFDGYPRTIKQAKTLDKFFKAKKINLDAVINLNLSETEAVKRALSRGQTSGRSDDNIKTIKTRFTVYNTQTTPLLKYYKKQKKVINIDGQLAIATVFKTIRQRLDK
ncbi:MAG: adenylate kinase [Candidatus Falkowbacteria bacterium]|nr:adenylate kinase [Candidatus Falkowbacteria bacterium]